MKLLNVVRDQSVMLRDYIVINDNGWPVLESVRFERCDIEGPAVLTGGEGDLLFDSCHMMWPTPQAGMFVCLDPRFLVGVVVAAGVEFVSCTVRNVGVVVPSVDEAVRWSSNLEVRP